jgi:hypothetical protein
LLTRAFSERRRFTFALAAAALACVIAAGALLAVDLYLHRKFERSGGVNVRGYKGPVVGRKGPGEFRIAVLGGSTAFGYGVRWDESFPAILERLLNEHASGAYTVVNLAYNNEGAYSFTFTMTDYGYLDYDLVCLYEGYNDLIGDVGAPNHAVFRHTSPIFRLTGYMPIFPLVFSEKAAALLHGGDLVYRGRETTVFRPGLATRTTAEILKAAADTGRALERQLPRDTAAPADRPIDEPKTGCQNLWQDYCRSMLAAVEYGVAKGKRALVVTQPYATGLQLRARHIEQQRQMSEALNRRFGHDARVAYVNLGTTIDLTDPALSFDQMHLTAAGNRRLAASLVAPVVALAAHHTPDDQ